jgi:aminoglycoside 6'-N-acetyltransferase
VPPEEPVHVVVLDRGRELSGVVHEGESWAAAARRTCASMHAEPEPVDLSGPVKQFVVDHDIRIAIRAMTRGDLDLVVGWRSDPEVVRWWSPGALVDRGTIEAKYAERIDGMSPTRMWVVEITGRSVGFVQDYRIGDYPDYVVLGPDPDAIGVDYAIGSEVWRGQGLGQRVLWAWMLRARTRFPGATSYFAAPDHRNAASLRILAKAGFTEGVWFDEPQPDGSATTMVGCTLDVARVIGPAT